MKGKRVGRGVEKGRRREEAGCGKKRSQKRRKDESGIRKGRMKEMAKGKRK
jgi:hypothetical protein